MPSKQELFNKGYLGVLAQGGPSVNEQGVCRYRGVNGTKCAVGHMIPDGVYYPGMEGSWITDLVKENPTTLGDDSRFLQLFQGCHDSAYEETRMLADEKRQEAFIRVFKEKTRWFVRYYQLTIPEIPNAG